MNNKNNTINLLSYGHNTNMHNIIIDIGSFNQSSLFFCCYQIKNRFSFISKEIYIQLLTIDVI